MKYLSVFYDIPTQFGADKELDDQIERIAEQLGCDWDGCGSGFNRRDCGFEAPDTLTQADAEKAFSLIRHRLAGIELEDV